MALDLKPLTNEIIHKMDYTPHDLWVVKLEDELFGPFEVESLKHYATENESQFTHALASRMDANDWQPFFTHAHFQPIAHQSQVEEEAIEKFWLLHLGQKAGPLSRRDIDKKFELDILSMTDVVSIDDGHTWVKFFTLHTFNTEAGGVDSLPQAPLESSFIRAREDLNEIMENQERTGSHVGLAALTYLGQHKGKLSLNLEEMDLKSLAETEVSRSLKWAIPSAVAGVGVLVMMGSFIFSPSTSTDTAAVEPEVIMPKTITHKAPNRNQAPRRRPASYQPLQHRSGITHAPDLNQNEYPTHVETHHNETDPMSEPMAEDHNQPPEQQ
ncbi:MAG: hypothetical protein H0V66_11235, partial [Bdellovibrionales bacterium]|nr:hypothetical protein [Bdellovibrionales bacterium]